MPETSDYSIAKEHQEYLQWLKTLKVGDEVVVESRDDPIITKISHITPGGKMRVERWNHLLFRDGTCYQSGGWHNYTIRKVTPEIVESIAARNRFSVVVNTNFRRLSPEKIKQIYDIVCEEK